MVADFDIDDLLGTELTTWSHATGAELPIVELRGFQKLWDQLMVDKRFAELILAANATEKARLLAVSAEESGAWLNARPAAC